MDTYSLKTILPPIRKQTETPTNQENTVDGSEILHHPGYIKKP